jgi:hypothetical protein
MNEEIIIYQGKNNEVDEKSNVRKTHIANSDKPVKIYSLDIILSVGYRTNSARANFGLSLIRGEER